MFVQYGDDHSQGLEQLWAALCRCWSGNLRHILTYLMTLASIMTNPDLLPYVSIKGLDEMNLEKYLIICAKL